MRSFKEWALQSSVVFTIYKMYRSDFFTWLFVAKKSVMQCKPLAERQEAQHSAVLSNSNYIYPYTEVINLHCRVVFIHTAGAVVIFWASNITKKILHQIYACEWLFISYNTVFFCFMDPICIYLNKLKSNTSGKIIPHITLSFSLRTTTKMKMFCQYHIIYIYYIHRPIVSR